MKNQKIVSLSAILLVSLTAAQAQFTAGNLVVLQEGVTGSGTALSSVGTAIFLNQYTTSGSFVNATAIPATGGSALVNSGSATSEGALTLSANGQYLVLAGYNAAAGTAGIASTTSAAAPRGVATVDASGNYTLAATTSTALSGNNIRSGTSDGSGNFWAAGAAGGTIYYNTPTTAIINSSTSVNNRVLQDIGGNLLFSTGSGTRGIYSMTGAPTTTGNTATLLFSSSTSASSPYDFAFNTGMTLAYVADDNSTGGIQRWDLIGSTWTLSYTLGTGAANIGARGLAVDFSGASPIIYATTAEATSDRLITITDTGAGSTATTLATAGLNTIFRGLDFAPVAVPEPSTLALAGVGLAGLWSFRRRNRK